MSEVCTFPKSVHVNQYHRFRLGRWELVTEHCRAGWGTLI